MGSYLSEPVTEKNSSDKANDKLAYGASSMQGWRVSQEDAHNSILDFDDNAAYFAVYDGHGGHEVAQYCAQKLPEFIKNTEAYKQGDIERALIEGFLGFDGTIATEEVIAILKEIAGEKEADEDDDDEENVNNLYEEASMPIEQVIEKYTNLVNPTLKHLKKGEKLPLSPMINAKKDNSVASCSASSSSEAGCSQKDASEEGSSSSGAGSSNSKAGKASSTVSNDIESSSSKSEVNGDNKDEDDKDSPSTPKPASNGPIPDITVTDVDSSETENNENLETPTQNGEITEISVDEDKPVGESVTSKGKGKSPLKKTPVKTRPKRNASHLYKTLLSLQESSEDEDTEDEEDKTFIGSGEESSEDEEVNEESSSDGDEADEEDEDEDGDEMDDDEDELEFARNMKEEPGSDSGCTAVVALLKGRELFVANAGDSRCIVCRNGKAVDMSFDHKPEDEPERERIVKAGGKVTADGRVNGGLNLSRAIGDHAYKQNKELNDREQMITALPDVKKLTINPTEDEFMVLACDGIWNFMSSQEVVDFVKPRLETNPEAVSLICEEMFDHCLAPNTMGDGTGCDNMTAIIVRFKPNLRKRLASPETDSVDNGDSKRSKIEQETAPESETAPSS